MNKYIASALIVGLCVGVMVPVVAFELGQNESERMTNNVPRVIPFTGQYSKTGQPFTGQVPMAFNLYDSTTSNIPVWPGSARTVDVKDGVFSVVLGDGNDAQTIPNEVFGNAAIYLEIVVQGTTLTPRQRLAPAPQAVYAAESAQAIKLKPTTVLNVGEIATFGLYCGSTAPTSGNFTSGNLTGVRAAKKLCESVCGQSAHMCSRHEIALSHQMGLVGPGSSAPSPMWVYGGATNSNPGGSNRDCLGFTSSSALTPNNTNQEGTTFIDQSGGFFDNHRCDQTARISCCDSAQ